MLTFIDGEPFKASLFYFGVPLKLKNVTDRWMDRQTDIARYSVALSRLEIVCLSVCLSFRWFVCLSVSFFGVQCNHSNANVKKRRTDSSHRYNFRLFFYFETLTSRPQKEKTISHVRGKRATFNIEKETGLTVCASMDQTVSVLSV